MNEKTNDDKNSKDLFLIDKILNNGETELFTELINKYKSPVFNLALRMTKNYSEAEDVTQEIFVKVYSKLNDYKVRFKFKTWIYSIATNAIMDRLRKRKFSFLSIDKPIEKEETQLNFDIVDNKTIDPETQLLDKEEKQKIYDRVNSLPLKYRTIIILRYFERLSYEEIVAVTKLPISSVKTRLHRGQKILFKKVTKK